MASALPLPNFPPTLRICSEQKLFVSPAFSPSLTLQFIEVVLILGFRQRKFTIEILVVTTVQNGPNARALMTGVELIGVLSISQILPASDRRGHFYSISARKPKCASVRGELRQAFVGPVIIDFPWWHPPACSEYMLPLPVFSRSVPQ